MKSQSVKLCICVFLAILGAGLTTELTASNYNIYNFSNKVISFDALITDGTNYSGLAANNIPAFGIGTICLPAGWWVTEVEINALPVPGPMPYHGPWNCGLFLVIDKTLGAEIL